MKRLSIITALLAVLLSWSLSFAAGTCVYSSTEGEQLKTETTMVWYLCTAHTDKSLSAALDTMEPLNNKWVTQIHTKPGSTTPTTDSELALTTSTGMTVLTAAANGFNLISATVELWDYPEDRAGNNAYLQLFRSYPITVVMTNNDVASAKFYLGFLVSNK